MVRMLCAVVTVCIHAWLIGAASMAQTAEVHAPARSAAVARGALTFSVGRPVHAATPPAVKAAVRAVRPKTATAVTPPLTTAQSAQPMAAVPAEPKPAASNSASAPVPPQPQTGIHAVVEMSEPKFISPPSPPTYPALARKRGQEGTVWVDVVLDADGAQSRLQILKSSGMAMLDNAALTAVSHWRFKPYEIGGVGQPSRVRIPIEFSLN